MPEPSAFGVEMAIENTERYISPVIDQIPAELIKAVGTTIHCEIRKHSTGIWNMEELLEEW